MPNKQLELNSTHTKSEDLRENKNSSGSGASPRLFSETVAEGARFRSWYYAHANSEREKLEKKIQDSEKKIKDIEKDFTKKIEELESKFEDSKIKVIEVLGLFVALFTFISTEFSFLQNASFSNIISLTLVLAGVLILFILTLDLIIRYWKYEWEVTSEKYSVLKNWKNHFLGLIIFSIILIVIGLINTSINEKFLSNQYKNNEANNNSNPASPSAFPAQTNAISNTASSSPTLNPTP